MGELLKLADECGGQFDIFYATDTRGQRVLTVYLCHGPEASIEHWAEVRVFDTEDVLEGVASNLRRAWSEYLLEVERCEAYDGECEEL